MKKIGSALRNIPNTRHGCDIDPSTHQHIMTNIAQNLLLFSYIHICLSIFEILNDFVQLVSNTSILH